MKKFISIALVGILITMGFSACSKSEGSDAKFDSNHEISVISREDGSGTRGAFIELMGIEVKGTDGKKTDKTTQEAIIANKTDVMMTNVSGDKYAIGYISLGSLNDKVKAVEIDGVKATPENIKNGSYKVARPFNIATKSAPTGVSADFINYILSEDGQAVVAKSYIPVNDKAQKYKSNMSSGKIVVAGSSSVTPIMEKLVEAYLKVNANANIEVQMSDSTAGMTGAKDGTCDIGMASRPLKESELESLTPIEIALDGIAVVVNKENPITSISGDDIKEIYVGNLLNWDEISK